MSVRPANARERAKWQEALRKYDRLSQHLAVLAVRVRIAQSVADHASEYGTTFAYSRLAEAQKALASLFAYAEKIGMAIDAAERGQLGIQLSDDGKDIAIVSDEDGFDPTHYRPGALPDAPQTLGIAPLVLALVAVVVIAGVITTIYAADVLVKKYDSDVQEMTLEAQKEFCADPQSPVCGAWIDQQKTETQKQLRGALDRLLGAGSSKKVIGGLILIGGIYAAVSLWRSK